MVNMVSDVTKVNSDWLESNRNIEKDQSFFEWYNDYTSELS